MKRTIKPRNPYAKALRVKRHVAVSGKRFGGPEYDEWDHEGEFNLYEELANEADAQEESRNSECH